ncbi:MAG: Cna B-type domain-containing protein, partial [Lachnospiraceae bacterium]|nr:Cna B-type domain-containing protein [Lachnospiraceae bacterium]
MKYGRRKTWHRLLSLFLAFMLTFSTVSSAWAEEAAMTGGKQETATERITEAETTPSETSAPETQAPETSAPETQAPSETAPSETSAPETGTTETQPSETQAPGETESSETSAPETQVPEISDSETAVTETETDAQETESQETGAGETAETETEEESESEEVEVITEAEEMEAVALLAAPGSGVGSEGEESLVAIASTTLSPITVTAGSSVDSIARDASFSVNIAYAFNGRMAVDTAKKYWPWVYDLSDFVANNPVKDFTDVTGTDHRIMQGSADRGYYQVINNKVYLYVDQEWLAKQTSSVSGTFQLSVSLDSSEVGIASGTDFSFPGSSTPIQVTYEDIKINSFKKVEGSETNDGSIKQITPNEDGSYTLHYEIWVQSPVVLEDLILADTASANQTIDKGSFTIRKNSGGGTYPIPENSISFSGDSSFSLDVADVWTANSGESFSAYEGYYVGYTTTVSAETVAAGDHLTNSSSWSWDGSGSRPGESTDIRIKKTLTIDKKVEEITNESGETVYKYTITIGDGESNLAGHKVTDWMTDLQVLEGDITLAPAEGSLPAKITPVWTNDGTYSTSEVKLFEYTFPEDQEYKGPYTITYQTKLVEEVDGIYGTKTIYNKAKEEGDDTEREVQTTINHDYGGEPKDGATVKKSLYKWDAASRQISYDVNVTIADDADLPLKNVVVSELKATYGNNQWTHSDADQLEILWDQISIADSDGNDVTSGYTVDATAGTVTFAELSKNVKIRIVAESPVDFANLLDDWSSTEFWAYNKVGLTVDGRKKNESETRDKYVSSEYSMNKTGSYDPETGEFTWVVTINPEQAVFNPDREVYFTDTLPEGMEFAGWDGDSGKVQVYVIGTDSNGSGYHGDTGSINVTCTNRVIQQVKINDIGWGPYNPAGLSGMMYRISYKTRLTDAEKAAVAGTNKTYTNAAKEVGSDGTVLKEASADVEYVYSYLSKEDLSPGELPFDLIEYQVIANPDKLTLNDGNPLTLSDTIASEVELVLASISVTGSNGAALSGVSVGYDDESRTVSFTIPDATYAKITFRVQVQELTDGWETFTNSVTLSGKTSYHAETSEQHLVKQHSATITGEANEVQLHKVDQYSLTTDLAGAKFNLYEITVGEDGTLGAATLVASDAADGLYTSDVNGSVTFAGLTLEALYYWTEVSAPEGYTINSQGQHYFMMYADADKDADSRDRAIELAGKIEAVSGIEVHVLRDHYTWTVTNLKDSSAKANIEVKKTLTGRNLAAGEFTFKLTAGTNTAEGGIATPMPENDTVQNTAAADGVQASFAFGDIKYSVPGVYYYTVEEIEPAADSLENVTYDTTVYNVAVTVERDEETGELKTPTVAYTKADGGAVSDGAVFNNTFVNKGSLKIIKKVVGESDDYTGTFYFTVQDADGKYYDAESQTFTDALKTVALAYNAADTSETANTLVIGDLDAGAYVVTETADAQGTAIAGSNFRYIVSENGQTVTVSAGSTSEITVTNTLHQVSVTVKKVWDDANDQDGKRPESISVVLKKNGTEEQTVVLNKENNWTVTVTGLDEYTGGVKNEYSWEEGKMPEGYSLSGTSTDGTVTTLTNTHTPETTSISGSKTWNDNNNQDGKRPESITINLLANGEEKDSKTVTPDASGNWSWSFTDLPKYENGEEIEYTITEDAVAGYTSEVTGYDVTNSYTPETTEVSGSKTWNDNNNQDGKRPESITINLLANGEEKDSKTVTPDASGNWSWSFTDLPKYENGEEIEYTITEDAVAGYTSEVTGYDVTNSYTPETTEVSGSKTWNDNNDQDGKRPESITIRVWNGNREVANATVVDDGSGNWFWNFGGLPKYENGHEIQYTITEDAVADYSTEYDGYNVINSYTPGKTSVSGSKTWNDAENQDGKRPESITIRVWNGTTEVASQEVTPDENGNWS